MDSDVFCAALVFTREYASLIYQEINLSPTVKVTWGSCWEIGIGCLKSRGAPSLLTPISGKWITKPDRPDDQQQKRITEM